MEAHNTGYADEPTSCSDSLLPYDRIHCHGPYLRSYSFIVGISRVPYILSCRLSPPLEPFEESIGSIARPGCGKPRGDEQGQV